MSAMSAVGSICRAASHTRPPRRGKGKVGQRGGGRLRYAAASWLHGAGMKLGFVSAIFPELPLDRVLAFARDEGFACIEVMCWPVGQAERMWT